MRALSRRDIVAHICAVAIGPGAGGATCGFVYLGIGLYALLDWPSRLPLLHAATGKWLPFLIAPGTAVAGVLGAYFDGLWARRTSGTPRPLLYAFLASTANVLLAALVLRPLWRVSPSLLGIAVVPIALAVLLARALFPVREHSG